MDANHFFGKGSVLEKFPKDITTSINALLAIIQSGAIEERRNDVIAALHGKVELTKLSFGVTTNALTINAGKIRPKQTVSKNTLPPAPPPATIVDPQSSYSTNNTPPPP